MVQAAKALLSSATIERRKEGKMRYALIQNGHVKNIIELNPNNAADFPSALPVPENLPVGIGDTYQDGAFYRNGERVPTSAETLALMVKQEPTEEPEPQLEP